MPGSGGCFSPRARWWFQRLESQVASKMGDAARKVWGFKGKQMMKSKRVLGAVDARPASGAGQRAYPAVFRDKASGQVLAAMSREQGRYGRPARAKRLLGQGWPEL